MKRKLKWTEYIGLVSAHMNPTHTFVVCVCRENGSNLTDERLTELVAKCNARVKIDGAVTWSRSYAGDLIESHWQHKGLAYAILDELLHAGVSVFTQTRMCVNIGPDELQPGETLTPEWLDRHTAIKQRARIERYVQEWDHDLHTAIGAACEFYSSVYSHESAWLTDEGRALVRWIVAHNKLNADSSDEEVTVPTATEPRARTMRVIVVDDDDADDARLQPAKKIRRLNDDSDSDTDVCMICLDKRPDTLALPCMHCVVCRSCSALLKQTPDARICVKCRRPVDDVLQDEQ